MSSKKTLKGIIDSFATETVIEENLENIIGDRFGSYSKYIIQDRAIPDIRDGLKPVQRRILYSMWRLGMFSNKPFKKSARIVGDVIGKYHPHGDAAVYDALVRMSQDFKMRLPLIDMHGNNGSIDGDSAAAMRYTESRLSSYAELLLEDLNKHTVGFMPNFDDEELEPIVLPSKFPNILVNGASGIASGYATDIPPHNPREVLDACIYLIDHPDAGVDELMQMIKGPDFPTGAIVHGGKGLKEAYTTGRGKIVVKSKAIIEPGKNDNKIIITEIPYEVEKASLIRKMNDQLVAKGIDGVRTIRDESDREGLRVVVEVRKDVNPETILTFLFKSTDLQKNYNFNMVAISKGRPVVTGIAEILKDYIEHQKEVLTNKSNFELEKARKRAHIVKGLIGMVSILDSVIATIKKSKNKAEAKENLINNYSFSELQAEAIVMLHLYRLTNTDIFELKTEQKELNIEIKNLEAILSSEDTLLNTIKADFIRTKEILDIPRKTQIEDEIEQVVLDQVDLVTKEDVVLMITHDGYLKRLTKKAYAAVNEPTKLKDGDVISDIYNVSTTDTLLQFTNLGNYVYLPIYKIPEVKHKDLGYHVSTLIGMEANEKIIFSTVISDFNEDRYVLIATKLGLIKRIALNKLVVNRYSKVLKATKLRDGDEVVSADICTGSDKEVVIATKDGFMNRYNSSEISIIEPASFGVKSIEMKSRPHDYVVGAKYIDEKDLILILTNRGNIKRFKPEEINKGKKNHVGKMYLKVVKSNMHEATHLEVIHYKNAGSDLESYIFCSKGYVPIDYTILRTAIADNGKKMVKEDLGKPEHILICHNDLDLDPNSEN